MKQNEIINFFDKLAPSWDADMIRSDEIINEILDNANVKKNSTVLDVACGTGVLVPDYLNRDIASVVGIDISSEMIKIAKSKYDCFDNISFICADVETANLNECFDCIVIYNAFPHFPNPENLIKVLSGYLKVGGTLTVAHGMSREKIDNHHAGTAQKFSIGLPQENELAKLFESYLHVSTKISDDRMYQVTGIKEKSK